MLPIENATLPRKGNRSFGAQRETHKHNGIDLPAWLGTPVRATAPGQVVHAHRVYTPGFSGYGRVVVLEHGNGIAYTLSAHLHEVRCERGDWVFPGQVIGTVGNSVFTKEQPQLERGGTHLHFEAAAHPYPMSNTVPRLDPVAWVEGTKQGAVATAATDVRFSGLGVAFALGAVVYLLAAHRG